MLGQIQSKMQTSALLAGFTSTVFGVMLTQSDVVAWRRDGRRARRRGRRRPYWDAVADERPPRQDRWRNYRQGKCGLDK